MKLRNEDSLGDMFRPGTILWRACQIKTSAKGGTVDLQVEPHKFSMTKSAHWLCRVRYPGNSIPEPEVISSEAQGGGASKGLVFLIDKLPDTEWTCLLLKNTSHAMRGEAPNEAGGASFVGKALFGTVMEGGPSMREYLIGRSTLY